MPLKVKDSTQLVNKGLLSVPKQLVAGAEEIQQAQQGGSADQNDPGRPEQCPKWRVSVHACINGSTIRSFSDTHVSGHLTKDGSVGATVRLHLRKLLSDLEECTILRVERLQPPGSEQQGIAAPPCTLRIHLKRDCPAAGQPCSTGCPTPSSPTASLLQPSSRCRGTQPPRASSSRTSWGHWRHSRTQPAAAAGAAHQPGEAGGGRRSAAPVAAYNTTRAGGVAAASNAS